MGRLTVCAALLAVSGLLGACGPADTHIPSIEPDEVAVGARVVASMGGDDGPDLRDFDDLELVAAPLVDTGSRTWDDMPSNEDEGRVLRGSVEAQAYRVSAVDLAPGRYAVWFRWDDDEHSTGYDQLTVIAEASRAVAE